MLGTYWNVEAADDITLSLLQERLNQLNTGVKIIMPGAGWAGGSSWAAGR